MESRKCEHCDGQIEERLTKRAKFCSAVCKDNARTVARRAAVLASRPERKCLQCGVLLPVEMKGNATWCSPECSWRWRNKDNAEKKRIKNRTERPPCPECGELLAADLRGGSVFCSPECKKKAQARRWRDKAPHYNRNYLYGLSAETYEAMLQAQGNACAICRSAEWFGKTRTPHVDHDHATGKVRGLLCAECNIGLGKLKDDPALLRAAADYLSREIPQ